MSLSIRLEDFQITILAQVFWAWNITLHGLLIVSNSYNHNGMNDDK